MSLMGYRSTLVRSVVVLTLFYGGGSVLAFYLMGPGQLQHWLEARDLWDAARDGAVHPLNAFEVATTVVADRVHAIGPWLLGGTALALGLVWSVAGLVLLARRLRARAQGGFRGLKVSLSTMPALARPETREVVVRLPDRVPAAHRPLLTALMGYLKAHENAWCGDGHGVGLLQHTLNVVGQALELEDADPLLPLAAAAHDVGKTTAYRKRGDQWVRVRLHDKESARILASLPEWWSLPMPDRSLVMMAVKHEHAPDGLPRNAPGLAPEDIKRLEMLVEQLRRVDGLATGAEKQARLADVDVEALVLGAFLRVIPQVPFQVRGMAKGIPAAGWRSGDRLYLLEHRVRDLAMAQMDADMAAALGGDYRAAGQTADFTRHLLPALAGCGWLVTEVQGEGESAATWRLPAESALWRIKAGKLTFNGVYIVKLPEDQRHMYPAESPYPVTVLGPLHGDQRETPRPKPTQAIPKTEAADVPLFRRE